MIFCSCNVLTKARILAAAEELSRPEPARPLTPGRIFRALGARPQCGTCFSLIRQAIADAGLKFTCPEPLATDAEDMATVDILEMEVVFDATEKVA
jgi:bacterioferritin-associated ferredoxin